MNLVVGILSVTVLTYYYFTPGSLETYAYSRILFCNAVLCFSYLFTFIPILFRVITTKSLNMNYHYFKIMVYSQLPFTLFYYTALLALLLFFLSFIYNQSLDSYTVNIFLLELSTLLTILQSYEALLLKGNLKNIFLTSPTSLILLFITFQLTQLYSNDQSNAVGVCIIVCCFENKKLMEYLSFPYISLLIIQIIFQFTFLTQLLEHFNPTENFSHPIFLIFHIIVLIAEITSKTKITKRKIQRQRKTIKELKNERILDDEIQKFSENESKEKCDCSICLEEGVSMKKLSCSHFYHPFCLREWLKVNNRCPLCRQNILKIRRS